MRLTRAESLHRRLRRLSTARLERRQHTVNAQLRDTSDLSASATVQEALRDEQAVIEMILRDRATPVEKMRDR